MNNLKQSAAELKKAGDRLFHLLARRLGSGPINEDSTHSSDLKAAVSVLRCCIGQKLPPKADIRLLNQAIKEQSITLTAEQTKKGAIKIGMWGSLWILVYHVAYYANCLADDSRLHAYQPLGICSQCDKIFMKRRIDQEFCSSGCRFDAFAAKRGKHYFAEKARKNRAARRALSRKRRK